MIAFCWLPPDMERNNDLRTLAAPDIIPLDQLCSVIMKAVKVQKSLSGKRFFEIFPQSKIILERKIQDDAHPVPVLRNIGNAGQSAFSPQRRL